MPEQYMTIDDFQITEGDPTVLEQEAVTVEAPEAKSLNIAISDILRIEENVFAFWDGVTGCCDSGRITAERDRIVDDWVAKKLLEWKELRWLRYGNDSFRVNCSSGRRPFPSNARWCNGRATIPCFIEFRRL